MNTRTITRDELQAMFPPPAPPTDAELDALRRLIRIAKGDSGQCRRCADFLLAWWNAGQCGGFDMTILWGVDRAIADDMVTVFGMIARVGEYPPRLDPALEADFAEIVRMWRPELAE